MKKVFLIICILTIAVLLRFYKLGQNPPALYWDEASLGYNGYAIATSLKDEHGEFLPLARFAAFGDYKPPGYIYAAAVSIKIFGLNEFSVRLPSAISGLLIVICSYLLVNEWFQRRKISFLVAFFVAISPWAIHFSRAAFEAHLAAFFNIAAIYLFVISKRKKWTLLISILFFILSFYTFNANRIIAPLFFIILFFIYFKQVKQNMKWIIISLIIGLLSILPSVGFLTSRESKIRFQEVSIWNNLVPLIKANNRIDLDQNTWWSHMIHNRRIAYGLDYLKHYFDNFSGRFLFTHGDRNPRLHIQDMGQLFVFDLILIPTGIYFLFRKKNKALFPLLLWIGIVPIPAGMAKETPHALRIVSLIPALHIISGYGMYLITKSIMLSKKNYSKVIITFFGFLLTILLFYYLHHYYIHFPIRWSGEWQYGYKEMVEYVKSNENNYDQIYVTTALGRPYIFFAFYYPYDSQDFLNLREETKDSFGFYEVVKLGKIRFGFSGLDTAKGRILLVGTKNEIPSGFQKLNTIFNNSGDEVFAIAQKS